MPLKEGPLLDLVLDEMGDMGRVAAANLVSDENPARGPLDDYYIKYVGLGQILLMATDVETAFVIECVSALRAEIFEFEEKWRKDDKRPVTESTDRKLNLLRAKLAHKSKA